jgi:hypothetical protein
MIYYGGADGISKRMDALGSTLHQDDVLLVELPLGFEARILSLIMAELTGFEPAISCVTGRHVRPLHHSSMFLPTYLVAGAGFEPTTFGL